MQWNGEISDEEGCVKEGVDEVKEREREALSKDRKLWIVGIIRDKPIISPLILAFS